MNTFDVAQNPARLTEQKKFMARVYGWMALALAISFASALAVVALPEDLQRKFIFNNVSVIVLCIAELALVFILSAQIRTMSLSAATLMFVAYSVINGLTLSSIFLIYQITSIFSAFLSASLMFGAMSIYGIKTKKDLTSMGRYLSMALIGIIIAVLVQFVLRLFGANVGVLDILISIATVVVFTGLTAYDTQKMLQAGAYANDQNVFKKASIIGALKLYLDFINIFLSLLRLFGKRRN